MPAEKTKTEPTKDAPTEAQLAKITGLADELGVEAPTPTTVAQAQEIIEKLQSLPPDAEPEPEPEPEDPDGEAESEEQQAAEETQARSGAERSDKQTQQLFDRAVRNFGQALRVIFEVDELQPAGTPGVIGFLLPGFTEQKTHEDFTRCQTCNGYGTVLTGSMKTGEDTATCPDGRCGGRGYWERRQVVQPQTPPGPAVTGPTAYPPAPAPNGNDEWSEAPAWLGDPRLSTGPTP